MRCAKRPHPTLCPPTSLAAPTDPRLEDRHYVRRNCPTKCLASMLNASKPCQGLRPVASKLLSREDRGIFAGVFPSLQLGKCYCKSRSSMAHTSSYRHHMLRRSANRIRKKFSRTGQRCKARVLRANLGAGTRVNRSDTKTFLEVR